MGDKARQPTVMVAVPVAQNEPVEPLGLEAEQREIAQQHLGGVAKIEQILPGFTRVAGFEMQRQAPFAGQGRVHIAANAADMLDGDHRVRRLRHELVEHRIDHDPHRQRFHHRRFERVDRSHQRFPLIRSFAASIVAWSRRSSRQPPIAFIAG